MGRKLLILGAGIAMLSPAAAIATARFPVDGPDILTITHQSFYPDPLLILLGVFAVAAAMMLRSRVSLVFAGIVLGVMALGIDIAFAADAGTPETVAQATNEGTKVTWAVGSVVSQWADAVEALLVALVAFALRKIPGQLGTILQTMHVDQILNKAIDYAINMVKGATKDKELSVDVGNEVLAKALQYVLDHSPGWLQSWMGGPGAIAQKIIARLNLAPDTVLDAGKATATSDIIAQVMATLKAK